MLQSINDLKGYDIIATDGEIENIEEFYFEDTTLMVRYLVANTGNWLTGKQNLIAPSAITHLDREKRTIHVNLTKTQVANSPSVDKHLPVSRQMEKLVSDYYADSYYWDENWVERPNLNSAQLASANAAAASFKSAVTAQANVAAAPDVHLRSMQEIANYKIAAVDGEIGEIEGFFVETDHWSIRYIGADTRHLLPGKHVLISAMWLGGFNWSHRIVNVNLTREQIKNSPDYEKVTEISREYETRLHEHYGQEKSI